MSPEQGPSRSIGPFAQDLTQSHLRTFRDVVEKYSRVQEIKHALESPDMFAVETVLHNAFDQLLQPPKIQDKPPQVLDLPYQGTVSLATMPSPEHFDVNAQPICDTELATHPSYATLAPTVEDDNSFLNKSSISSTDFQEPHISSDLHSFMSVDQSYDYADSEALSEKHPELEYLDTFVQARQARSKGTTTPRFRDAQVVNDLFGFTPDAPQAQNSLMLGDLLDSASVNGNNAFYPGSDIDANNSFLFDGLERRDGDWGGY